MLHPMEMHIQNVAILQIFGRTPYKSTLRHTWSQQVHRTSIRSFLQSSHRYMTPEPTSLGKLHRWGSYIAGGAASLGELHRWGSLHGSSRLSSSGYWAGGTSGCCGGVLKVQPPQVLRSRSSCMDRPIGFSALAPAHLLCSNSACILQEKRDFRAMNDSHSYIFQYIRLISLISRCNKNSLKTMKSKYSRSTQAKRNVVM